MPVLLNDILHNLPSLSTLFLPVPDLLPGSFLLIVPSERQQRFSKKLFFWGGGGGYMSMYSLPSNIGPLRKCKHISSLDSPIQLPRMVEKIFFLLASSISVKDRKLKWRVKRWVIGFRPPPGGPMAQAKLMSTMCLNVPVEKEQGDKREAQSNKITKSKTMY